MDKKQELYQRKKHLMRKLIQECIDELGGFGGSYRKLAQTLSEPLRPFNLSFSKQLIWSWADMRYLPYPAKIRVLASVAEEGTLAKKFADRALEILAMKETKAQKNIRELGYESEEDNV
jgi:hypothetical protein